MLKAASIQLHEHDRRIFWGVFSVFVLASLAYFTFLGMTIGAALERNHAERDITTTTTHLATLETKYVAEVGSIDLALAHEKGFIEVTDPHYLSSGSGGIGLTLRDKNSTHP
jgi:hypothetical protein